MKLNVDQITNAICQLDEDEKLLLFSHLKSLLEKSNERIENYQWLCLAEGSFEFWNDPEEDLYQDLISKEK